MPRNKTEKKNKEIAVMEPEGESSEATETESKDVFYLRMELNLLKLENNSLKQRLEEVTDKMTALEKKVKMIEKSEKADKSVIQNLFDSCSSQLILSLEGIMNRKYQEMEAQLAELSSNLVEKKVEIKFQEHHNMTKISDNCTQDKENKQEVLVQIQEEVKEQQNRLVNAKKIRVGGINKDWWKDKEKDYNLNNKLQELIPSIQWNSKAITSCIQLGSQLVVTFQSEQDKIDILRQTSKLRGTKFWIAEELTRIQLTQKSAELQKVKIARAEGKWAVYRNGVALIRDFKTIKEKTQRNI